LSNSQAAGNAGNEPNDEIDYVGHDPRLY